jgi:hypothetical protein
MGGGADLPGTELGREANPSSDAQVVEALGDLIGRLSLHCGIQLGAVGRAEFAQVIDNGFDSAIKVD